MIYQTASRENGRLVVGDLVPFSFRLYSEPSGMPLYLMIGDSKHSLLEIKVDKESGVVIGVTLTLFAHPISHRVPEGLISVSRENGWISYDVNEWQGARRDEHNNFSLFRTPDKYFLIFQDFPRSTKCVVGARIGFFIASNRLCGIEFFDLTQEELSALDKLWSRSRPTS